MSGILMQVMKLHGCVPGDIGKTQLSADSVYLVMHAGIDSIRSCIVGELPGVVA